MQDMCISVKSIKNHANRRYGFMPYAAIYGFDLFLKWQFMDLASKMKICDSRCQINKGC
ncbi:MAG: hypothetical protein K2I10_13300 [Lachnospiraceae bacterium]|nr:hypothetical protein [Lachnospiraceae bacterium]